MSNYQLDIEQEINRDPRLKSEHTRRAYKNDLFAFETWRSSRPITKRLVEEYAAERQKEEKSFSTINRMLAAVRWWARKISDLADEGEQIDTAVINQALRITKIKRVRGEREPAGREITAAEMVLLLGVCEGDSTEAGARDGALFALAYCSGMRRSELANLLVNDLDLEEKDMGIMRIVGKGNKERYIPVTNEALILVSTWIGIRGNERGPVFCVVRGEDRVEPQNGLGGEGMRMILERRRKEAKVKHCTWHDFRRTFAGNLLDAGVDLATVQRLMGHANPDQTTKYDRRKDAAQRAAIKQLHLPYVPRRIVSSNTD